jgi:hypothetical protein
MFFDGDVALRTTVPLCISDLDTSVLNLLEANLIHSNNNLQLLERKRVICAH